MLKVLHCGDVHLDSPFSLCDIRQSEVRQRELRETFAEMFRFAASSGVGLILVSGDLFDVGYVTKQTVSFICSVFSGVPDIKIVISPGNHDPYAPGGVYTSADFPPNVYIFDKPELSVFSFDDIGADVYGYAFTSERMTDSPLAGKNARKSSRFNLICAHADLDDPLSRYAPVTKNTLAAFGADYAALGHVHNDRAINVYGPCTEAYCGFPEGRGFDETGYGGAVVVSLSEDNGKKTVSAERRRFSKRRYEIAETDVTGAGSDADVIAAVGKKLGSLGCGKDTYMRVILRGEVRPDFSPSKEALNAALSGGLYYFETEDETLPMYGGDYLRRDLSVRGALYRALEPKLKDPDKKTRELAVRALRYGLAALDGRDVAN